MPVNALVSQFRAFRVRASPRYGPALPLWFYWSRGLVQPVRCSFSIDLPGVLAMDDPEA